MEFGFVDSDTSTNVDTDSDSDSSDTASTASTDPGGDVPVTTNHYIRGTSIESWLDISVPNHHMIPSPKNVGALSNIQVVPPIIRKYHKPPSRTRNSLSSLGTVVIQRDDDEESENESILMPFISNTEFDRFPPHIITVENTANVAMANAQHLSILMEADEDEFQEHSSDYVESVSGHSDTEVIESDPDQSSVSWTETQEFGGAEVRVRGDSVQEFVDDYLDKRDAHSSLSKRDLKRNPQKTVNSNDFTADTPERRHPAYVDFVASKETDTDLAFNGRDPADKLATPSPRLSDLMRAHELNHISDFPDAPKLTPMHRYLAQQDHKKNWDSLSPMQKFLQYRDTASTPDSSAQSSLASGMTPFDKLLESLPPVPPTDTKKASIDSFHALPDMTELMERHFPQYVNNSRPPRQPEFSHYLSSYNSNNSALLSSSPISFQMQSTPLLSSSPASFQVSNPLLSSGPLQSNLLDSSPPSSFVKSSPPSQILLCKIEPESPPTRAKTYSDVFINHHQDLEISDILSDDIIAGFTGDNCEEFINEQKPFLTTLIHKKSDTRLTVIE